MAADIRFSLVDLDLWVEKGLITPDQRTHIRAYIEASGSAIEQNLTVPERRKGLNFITIAYYFGAFMILLAYTFFMGIRWESLGVTGEIVVSFFSVVVLSSIGAFLRRNGFVTAGGLLIFAGTGITPLLIYTLQRALGIWPPGWELYGYSQFYTVVAKTWVPLELISILVAGIVIWRVRFPLLTLLIAFWMWFFSMDLMRLLEQSKNYEYSQTEQIISVLIGLGMLAIGIYLQRRATKDYSLWLFIFGHIIILSHMTPLTLANESSLGLVFITVYLIFVVFSVWLQRRVFLIFGAIGCYGYLSYLAFQVFGGELGFVYALASIGLVIVLSAVGYQKYFRKWLEKRIQKYQLSKT